MTNEEKAKLIEALKRYQTYLLERAQNNSYTDISRAVALDDMGVVQTAINVVEKY